MSDIEARIKEYRAKIEELETAKAVYYDKWLNARENIGDMNQENATLRAQVAQLTNDVEKWSGLYSRLQDERAADFAKWFKIIDFGGLTEYQAECPQVIDDALRQLENWRWAARMGLVVQAMASECAGKPDWAVLDVDGDMLGYGSTPMDAIKAAKKEVEGE